MTTRQTPRSVLTDVGGWKLGKTLGRGAYAHVRLATHRNGHQAACKILPALHRNQGTPVTWDETIDAVEAHKEVVLLKALCGAGLEGIAGLEGVIEEGGWTYVFLTLYPCSVSSLPNNWTYDSLIIFFRRLLHTVHNLHRLNVSHEDIKRSNVLADDEGFPVLVDFGFSHFKCDGGFVKSAGGTLDYSSPEKTADKRYDPKANDVWALGILFTKLLGIPHPYAHSYTDDTSSTVKRRILMGEAKFSWKLPHLGQGGVAELILGMLNRDPGSRWTIPQILKHPFLRTGFPDPPSFQPPSDSFTPLHRPSQSVVEDLCFLSYLNGNFALCETSLRIEERLEGKEPCWEKRWSLMLGAWSKRAEMDWEDIPTAITPLVKLRNSSTRAVSNKVAEKNKGRTLREINLISNIPPPEAKQVSKAPKPLRSRFYRMKSKDYSQAVSLTSRTPILAKQKSNDSLNMDHAKMFSTNEGRRKNGIIKVKKARAKTENKVC
nr:CAMK/CAMKL protein kinase [Cryptococcus depauperatus CBS 7855]